MLGPPSMNPCSELQATATFDSVSCQAKQEILAQFHWGRLKLSFKFVLSWPCLLDNSPC